MKFISQKNQDEWVIKDVFNYKRNGYFVDLASADGIHINNTYLLEKELGWTGICIEPNPIYYEQCKKNRNCIILQNCIDYKNHQINFRIDNGQLGGIIDKDTDNNMRIRNNQIINSYNNNGVIKMITKTLEQVLDENNAPKTIDFLSLDVEGAETRVLQKFPFNKYKFLSMVIERPTPELNNLLFKNGYIPIRNSETMSKKAPYDTFYVHKTIENLDKIKKFPFKQIPPKDW